MWSSQISTQLQTKLSILSLNKEKSLHAFGTTTLFYSYMGFYDTDTVDLREFYFE